MLILTFFTLLVRLQNLASQLIRKAELGSVILHGTKVAKMANSS